jgi:hypothetical protein
MHWFSNLWWDAGWKRTKSKTPSFLATESLISAHDILSWIKQEEQPYPWGPRDSMEGELGLDSGPSEYCVPLLRRRGVLSRAE